MNMGPFGGTVFPRRKGTRYVAFWAPRLNFMFRLVGWRPRGMNDGRCLKIKRRDGWYR